MTDLRPSKKSQLNQVLEFPISRALFPKRLQKINAD
jgi:hypothetical protein